ncbi:hypothetical protein AYJ54_42850 [Bradyrhizobium centrolobii]|uniref:Uncharacterized protein n=1 Tax=Bradyrhizobium centrolobii TaxID=1505087 RepID=A0A176Z1P8_9BRAD|nr:hypothetical protein AYJ54_42850 [Bradyrhizobium centrolobii]
MCLKRLQPRLSLVTLYGQGQMTLRTAVQRGVAQKLHGLDATIFREAQPSLLDHKQIAKLAAEWS